MLESISDYSDGDYATGKTTARKENDYFRADLMKKLESKAQEPVAATE